MIRGSTPRCRPAENPCHRMHAAALGLLGRREHDGGASVGDPRRRTGGDDAGVSVNRFEHQRQFAQSFDCRAGARMFVDSSSTGFPFASRPGAGVISSLNRPAATAASARRWLSRAYASDSSRVMPYCRARTSAVWPMRSCDRGQKNPSRYIASTSGMLPILWPHRASSLSMRCGIRLIDSMPPARTTLDWPRRMACAPSATACNPEAQA